MEFEPGTFGDPVKELMTLIRRYCYSTRLSPQTRISFSITAILQCVAPSSLHRASQVVQIRAVKWIAGSNGTAGSK